MPPTTTPQRSRCEPLESDESSEPFSSASEAWFWYMACHQAKLDGARVTAGLARVNRPCEPGDIFRIVSRLYSSHRLSREHLRVMVRFGRTMLPPDPAHPGLAVQARSWNEGMTRLEGELVARGIVA